MTEPLKPRERLVVSRADERPRREARRTKPPSPNRPRRGGPGWLTRFAARVTGALFALAALVLIVGAGAGYMAYRYYSADLPDVDGLRNYEPPLMTRVFASDGRLIADFATERRIFVPYSAIPDVVKQAFVSAEDQNFWTHPGIDPLAIARAARVRPVAHGPGTPADRRLHDHPAGRQEHAAGQPGLARRARPRKPSWRCGSTTR